MVMVVAAAEARGGAAASRRQAWPGGSSSNVQGCVVELESGLWLVAQIFLHVIQIFMMRCLAKE